MQIRGADQVHLAIDFRGVGAAATDGAFVSHLINQYFLDWVGEQKHKLGLRDFRDRQDERNTVVERDRTGTNRLQAEQAQEGVEYQFEVICNNDSTPHRFDLTAAELGDNKLVCVACDHDARLVAQKKMENFPVEGRAKWVETQRQLFNVNQPGFSASDMMWAWLFGRLSGRR